MFQPRWEGQVCSLGYDLAARIEDDLGLELTNEQVLRLVRLYELDPTTGRRLIRRAALRRPKGAGKSPEGGYCGYAELCLPVRFSHWSKRGQPVGAPVTPANGPPTGPWVQFAAVSEDQTDNVLVWLYETLAEHPETRERHGIDLGRSRIYLNGRPGRIEPVTAAAGSREGQPITFAVLDQTESWYARNGGRKLANVLRRNAGKMGGWTYELQNAPEPGDGSVADETGRAARKTAAGVLYDTREAPEVDFAALRSSDPTVRAQARLTLTDALAVAYGEAVRWVDLERLADEIQDPATDESDARRYYLNQETSADERAFDAERWRSAARTELADGLELVEILDQTGTLRMALRPRRGEQITLGFDGAQTQDATALIGTHVSSGFQWPVGIWERPEDAPDDWSIDTEAVDAAIAEAFDTWKVWRAYCDPPYWQDEIKSWQGRWGQKRVIRWMTGGAGRIRPVAAAIKTYRQAVGGDLTHDGDPLFAEHIGNARRSPTNAKDDEGHFLWILRKPSPRSTLKIDAAMAAVLSWEARGDCIAAGRNRTRRQVAFSM